MSLVDAHGQPFEEPGVRPPRADTETALMPSLRAEISELVRKVVSEKAAVTPGEWYRSLGWNDVPAKLPDGVSLRFDEEAQAWVLRDSYRKPKTLIGCTPDRELALNALQNYVEEIERRQRKRKVG